MSLPPRPRSRRALASRVLLPTALVVGLLAFIAGPVPVSLRVPSAAPRSTVALTSAKIVPCNIAASRISPSPAAHRWA